MTPYFQREFRELAHTPRWQIARTIQKQDVAQHCFFVAMYTDRACNMLGWSALGKERLWALQWALYHDLPEAGIGDIQAPTKRRMDGDGLRSLEHEYVATRFGAPTMKQAPCESVHAVVKFADMLDQVMFVVSEMQLGNQTLGSSVLDKKHPGRPENVAQMTMRHLKDRFDDMAPFNATNETMDYMWRTYVIASIIQNGDMLSHIIQDVK